ncbi:hypothetical protein CPB86DRAFT_783543 [Serendipita vermifera]|nr:hypothetical protein CPB86DRAFT_783543 [Serendipita vermifera]
MWQKEFDRAVMAGRDSLLMDVPALTPLRDRLVDAVTSARRRHMLNHRRGYLVEKHFYLLWNVGGVVWTLSRPCPRQLDASLGERYSHSHSRSQR